MTFDNDCFCMETKTTFITLPCQHRIHEECSKQMVSDQCPWCRTPMGIIHHEPVPIRYRYLLTYQQYILIGSNFIIFVYFLASFLYLSYGGNYYVSTFGWIIYSLVYTGSFIILNLILYCLFKYCG